MKGVARWMKGVTEGTVEGRCGTLWKRYQRKQPLDVAIVLQVVGCRLQGCRMEGTNGGYYTNK